MHYSRIMPSTSKFRYFTSTAVLLNEIIKLSICVAVAFYERRQRDGPYATTATTIRNLYRDVFADDSWKVAIPAALYTLQNTLQYVAVSNLDAATFQVTYQLKILTTALFSVTMLGRRLTWKRWISLILLTVGIAIVQLPTNTAPKITIPDPVPGTSVEKRSLVDVAIQERTMSMFTSIFERRSEFYNSVKFMAKSTIERRSGTYQGIHEDRDNINAVVMNNTMGLTAVIIACTISGLAGVYFERVLKGSNATLWIRNIQLSFYSLFPAFFIGVWYKDGHQISQLGFFYGYNKVVWTAIAFQAIGGIVVALCVNFADNIAKNFATSISILISFLASVYFFDFAVTINVSRPTHILLLV